MEKIKEEISNSTKEEKAYELLKYLFSVHQDNEIFVENLHELFVSFSLDDESKNKDQVTNSYLALRAFLKNAEKLIKV
jgi:hypothetical protein